MKYLKPKYAGMNKKAHIWIPRDRMTLCTSVRMREGQRSNKWVVVDDEPSDLCRCCLNKKRQYQHHNRPTIRSSESSQSEYVRENWASKTIAASHMEKELSRSKVRFRSEFPIGKYIADFFLFQLSIVIEVDGGYHQTPQQQAKDAVRTRFIESRGYKVLRITNKQVLHREAELFEMMAEIKRAEFKPCRKGRTFVF